MSNEILIVEDDIPILQLFEKMISRAGYPVTAISRGDAALAWLATGQPALIMLDLTLPGDVNGVDILQYIDSAPHLTDAVIVVISAHPRLPAEYYHNRIARVITKPARPSDIIHTIQTLLATQS